MKLITKFYSILLSLGVSVVLMLLAVVSCSSGENETIVVQKNDETYSPDAIRPILDEWQRRTFTYFYEGAEPNSGMAYEGNDRDDNVVTTGGTGFGIMALIVGSERGWITREQAANQLVKIVRFLDRVPRYKGVWSHWYNPDGTQHAFEDAQQDAGDIVETSFLMSGLLCAEQYFNANNAAEKEIRDAVDSFWNSVDWKGYANGGDELSWYWSEKTNTYSGLKVGGNWNETWSVWLQALAAPEGHNMTPDQYKKSWLMNGGLYQYKTSFGYDYQLGWDRIGPLFFSHYSFLGYNPRVIQDSRVFYWNQNVVHTMINRHYCLTEASKKYLYDENNWGLTACYGTGGDTWVYRAREAHPANDDGVIAPTAALSAFPYTPFYSTQVLLNLVKNHTGLRGTYGFGDAYRPMDKSYQRKHLAIDQGPIVVMIENYRTGLIWNLMMKSPRVTRGLELAGVKSKPTFKEGFHIAVLNTLTQEYDMMRHPDRGSYEIDFWCDAAQTVRIDILNGSDKSVLTKSVEAKQGENLYSFDSPEIKKGRAYTIRLTCAQGGVYTLPVRLR